MGETNIWFRQLWDFSTSEDVMTACLPTIITPESFGQVLINE